MPDEKEPEAVKVYLPVEAMTAWLEPTRPATQGFEFSRTTLGLMIKELLTSKLLMNVLVVLMNTIGST